MLPCTALRLAAPIGVQSESKPSPVEVQTEHSSHSEADPVGGWGLGPRQSGKTTLLKSLFPDYTYVSLENPDNRSFAEDGPNGFLQSVYISYVE
ncbi:AAA family ATPase [Parapedobacter sp.]